MTWAQQYEIRQDMTEDNGTKFVSFYDFTTCIVERATGGNGVSVGVCSVKIGKGNGRGHAFSEGAA